MKLISVWVLSLIYCAIGFCHGKNVVVDLATRESNDDMNLREYVEPNGARKYVFSAKEAIDFAGVKHGKLKLMLRGRAKAKKITMFKSHKGILLVIPQGSNWKRTREIKDAYYRVEKRSIKKITQRMFSYYQHIMTWKLADIDIRKENDNILRYVLKDGSEKYSTFGVKVFVLQVREGKRHIWPDKKDMGGVFLRGIYRESKGKSFFVVNYADVDGQEKTSYFQSSGKSWKRIPDKKGKKVTGL